MCKHNKDKRPIVRQWKNDLQLNTGLAGRDVKEWEKSYRKKRISCGTEEGGGISRKTGQTESISISSTQRQRECSTVTKIRNDSLERIKQIKGGQIFYLRKYSLITYGKFLK